MSSQIPLQIFHAYGLSAERFGVEKIGTGHIHFTYKLTGAVSYVLQRVNKNVFTKPDIIASNLRIAATYLAANFPDYLFLTPVLTKSKEEMVYDDEGFPWRLYPFFSNTYTIDRIENPQQAYDAAAAFGKLSKNLEGIETTKFWPTIDRFHDLQWRWEQFVESLTGASEDRLADAQESIASAKEFRFLVTECNRLIDSRDLKLRITHNDTKINNILFDLKSGKPVCPIDLDTLMPGYFIYDIGDMIRTFVSPVDEEEKDLSKIAVRSDILDAVVNGYLSEMNSTLSVAEKKAIPFSGMMMTYIMALRMLTDYLNGDIYYQIKYAGQNLVRANNQFRLLQRLQAFHK